MNPSAPEFLEFSENLGFKSSKDAAIRPFYLPVSPWVCHRGPSHVNLLLIIEVHKFTSRELGSIVCDDGIHDIVLVYDLVDELDRAFGAGRGYGPCLNPFGELVDYDEQVFEASKGSREFPDKIESPNSKGPCDWDRLELLRGYMLLLGKELAPQKSSDNLLRVPDDGRPVKPLSKGLPTKVFGAAW